MQAYLKGLLLWEVVEMDTEVILPNNSTLNQMKTQEEKISKSLGLLVHCMVL